MVEPRDDPTLFRVNNKLTHGAILSTSKKIMLEHGVVTISGAGATIPKVVNASDKLISLGYATLMKISTDRKAMGSNISSIITIRLLKAPTFEEAERKFRASKS
jgi:hypothetical protein